MTPTYTKKLIQLAEEIEEYRINELYFLRDSSGKESKKFINKLDYLLAYILALKEKKTD